MALLCLVLLQVEGVSNAHATLRNKEFTSRAEEKRDRYVFGRFSCLLEPNQGWVVRCDFAQVKPVEEREPERLIGKLSE